MSQFSARIALAVSRSCVGVIRPAQVDSWARLSSRFAPIRGKPRLWVRIFSFMFLFPFLRWVAFFITVENGCSDSEFVKFLLRLLSAFTSDQVGDWPCSRRVK